MHQDPIWALIRVLEAPFPIQIPACGLGKQFRMVQSLGILHLCVCEIQRRLLTLGIGSAKLWLLMAISDVNSISNWPYFESLGYR